MFEGIIEVRASAGDNRLGGDDFNDVMVKLARPLLNRENLLESIPADRYAALLTQSAERARRELTQAEQARFSLTIDDEVLETTISADAFAQAAEPLLRRLRDPVIRSLRDCGIDAAELSEIVLVGGATRMPVVRKALTRMFGRFPNSTVHPDHAVALGAAVQAGLLARDAALDEVRISDVAPFTLGVEVGEHDRMGQIHLGIFSPIIERNTPVPVSREHSYSTLQDNQRQVEMVIYQGEARLVKENVKLGEISVPLPARPAGEVAVKVRFTYDSSGLLEVDVSVPETGVERNLVIVDEEDRKATKDMEARRQALAKLKFHPRDDAQNLAAMARARRCYEGFTGQARQEIGQVITQFEGALDKQDPRLIADAREQMIAFLDTIEAYQPL
jgi:molecular chaperone HscC